MPEAFTRLTWARGIDPRSGRPIDAAHTRVGELLKTIAPGPGGRWQTWVSVDGKLTQKPGTERKIPAQLVTLAMGFTGTDRENGLVEQFGLELDERGNIARDADFQTNVPGVFVAGDAGRGQSLIVWAIAEGRSAARGVDRFLTGASDLPAPIRPTDRALMV